jgi:hypothetical protein
MERRISRELISAVWNEAHGTRPCGAFVPDEDFERWLEGDDTVVRIVSWFGNTSFPKLTKVYYLDGNFEGNLCFDIGDLIDEEEFAEIVKKYGDDASYSDRTQIESIGIDYDDRVVDFLYGDGVEYTEESLA